jgi:hypothetical protein
MFCLYFFAFNVLFVCWSFRGIYAGPSPSPSCFRLISVDSNRPYRLSMDCLYLCRHFPWSWMLKRHGMWQKVRILHYCYCCKYYCCFKLNVIMNWSSTESRSAWLPRSSWNEGSLSFQSEFIVCSFWPEEYDSSWFWNSSAYGWPFPSLIGSIELNLWIAFDEAFYDTNFPCFLT